MGKRQRGLLLCLEVLVCFAPLGAMLLLGTLMLPVWVGMFIAYVGGAPIDNSDGLLPWVVLLPITMVVAGLVGLVGIVRLLYALIRDERRTQGRRLTLAAVCIGLAGVLLYNGYVGTQELTEAILLLFLPLASSAHLLYLGRTSLLGAA